MLRLGNFVLANSQILLRKNNNLLGLQTRFYNSDWQNYDMNQTSSGFGFDDDDGMDFGRINANQNRPQNRYGDQNRPQSRFGDQNRQSRYGNQDRPQSRQGRGFQSNDMDGYNGYSQKQSFFQANSELEVKLDDSYITKDILQEYNNQYEPSEFNQFMQENNVLCDQEIPTNPLLKWNDLTFPNEIQNQLKTFQTPTPIQAITIPVGLKGIDVIGVAQTGSGKTAAFLIPIIMHIKSRMQSVKEPISLIICPTRELAQQIQQEFRKLTYRSNTLIKVATLYGGSGNKFEQQSQLRMMPQLIIATPGRLYDFMQTNQVKLSHVSQIILDEADRMLDMGFKIQIEQIRKYIRTDAQCFLFTATWPVEVQQIYRSYTGTNSLKIQVGSNDNGYNENIRQFYELVYDQQKLDRLFQHLECIKNKKVLIFVNTKRDADHIQHQLQQQNLKIDVIHGDKQQRERDYALNRFKRGQIDILVATDVASRGIDVKDISYVINYDFPQSCEDYVHRIGRTGRAGQTGTSISFITEKNSNIINQFIEILIKTKQPVTHGLMNFATKKYDCDVVPEFTMEDIHQQN